MEIWKYFVIIILVCLIFKLCLINEHLRKMLWGFKSKYDSQSNFLLRNRMLISYMSSYEDTGTKTIFIMQIIFQYSMKYDILLWNSCKLLLLLLHFFIHYTLPQKHINMQISFVLVMIKPVYGHFTLVLQKEKWYIKTFYYKIFENHLYTKFGKKNNLNKPEN